MTISKVKLPPTGGSKVTLKHLGWEIFAPMLKKPYTHNMMRWLKACRCLSLQGRNISSAKGLYRIHPWACFFGLFGPTLAQK